jgi:hypothetical protein
MTFSSMPSAKPPAPPPKPPITWSIPFMAGTTFHQWADGSIKIIFPADQAEAVTEHFRNVVKAMEVGMEMIKNPPKKCPGCRGQGQIVVKNGEARETQVCPGCNGSGMKIHRPTDPSKLMTRNTGHVPPLAAPLLPHQTYVDPRINNEQPKAPQGPQVQEPQESVLREVDAQDLASEFAD